MLEQKRKLTPLEEKKKREKGKNCLFPCTSCVIIVKFDLSQSVHTAAVHS